MTSWRFWSSGEWRRIAENHPDAGLKDCPPGHVVVSAEIRVKGDPRTDADWIVSSCFTLGSCARCCYEAMEPEVQREIARLTGWEEASLATTSFGLVDHGVTLGEVMRRTPLAA